MPSAPIPKLDRDVFLVNQKHRSWMKSKYYVFDKGGAPLFYVERPVKPFRRSDITIYDDDSRTSPVLIIRQDHRYAALKRSYTLLTPGDESLIAHFERNNIRSWIRRAWAISGAEGVPIAAAREDSAWLAILRRVIEQLPYISLVMGLVRTNFQIYLIPAEGAEVRVGSFDRKFSIGDKYALNLADDSERRLDRRIALALGILLDTGEAR